MKRFSCVVIGSGTLLLHCVDVLLHAHHTICGIASPDAALREKAAQHAIPYHPSKQQLVAFVRQQPFDYIFSIVNKMLLPHELLSLPRKAAINFHDAPLPRYAGSYATTWAIINREPSHGISWHEMTSLVDGGAIYQQVTFPLEANETALSLNLACYHHAMHSFTELVQELAEQRAHPYTQDMQQRTFYPHYQRPPGACVFGWHWHANDIDALVRALHFGTTPNPVGIAKCLFHPTSNRVYAVLSASVAATEQQYRSERPIPGTIMSISPTAIRVATATDDVVLHTLSTLHGQPLTIDDVVAQEHLAVGMVVSSLAIEHIERLTAYYEHICRHETFWMRHLADLHPMQLLFTGRKTMATVISSSTPCRTANVPAHIVETVQTHCDTWHQQPFFMAAFVAFLARVSSTNTTNGEENDQCDVAYQSTTLQQHIAGLEHFFASWVPFRIHVNTTHTYRQLYVSVQRQEATVTQRATYALDMLMRSPALRDIPPSLLTLPIAITHGNPDEYICAIGQELVLVLHADGCCWCYDGNCFDPKQLERLFGNFVTFAENVLRMPDVPLAEVPLVNAMEYYAIVEKRNHTQAPYPAVCLHHLFEQQTERTPTAIAVSYEGTTITYEALNHAANHLATQLIDGGVTLDTLVGICLERSREMVVGVLAILKAGGAYVPLDPTYPTERLAFIVNDTHPPVILTTRNSMAALPPHHANIILIDTVIADATVSYCENPPVNISPERLAYVIYTSGSTGTPKGVLVPHRAVVNHIWHNIHAIGMSSNDILFSVFSLSFDPATADIFLPLACGARLVLVRRSVTSDGIQLARQLDESQATVMQATPATWKLLLEAGWQGHPNLTILSGGDTFSWHTAEQLLQRGKMLWNLYGPTETTMWSTMSVVHPSDGDIGIGNPIANTQIYVLDKHMQPLPDGVPGELYVGGDGVARGYLNQALLTAERFVLNPFVSTPQTYVYKTGDKVVFSSQLGKLKFVERVDDQVKIRGFRIELGEVAHAIRQHPMVQECLVTVRPDAQGERHLVAYYISNQPIAFNDITRFLQTTLPSYMVPAAFVRLDVFPLTATGKINYRALPTPDTYETIRTTPYVAPRTPIEATLAEIWHLLFQHNNIGMHDNFFQLGGNSLLATQITSRIRDALHVEVAQRILFETPTIAAVADYIATHTTHINTMTNTIQEYEEGEI